MNYKYKLYQHIDYKEHLLIDKKLKLVSVKQDRLLIRFALVK